MNFLLILYRDPRDGDAAWNALRIANQMSESGLAARVFLLDRGVWTSHPSMLEIEEGMAADSHMILNKLLEKKLPIRACGTCVERAGFDPREISEGIEIATLPLLAEWISLSERIVTI